MKVEMALGQVNVSNEPMPSDPVATWILNATEGIYLGGVSILNGQSAVRFTHDEWDAVLSQLAKSNAIR